MKKIESLSKKRLKKLIKETEKTLSKLNKEVIRREQANQNDEIDDLEQHMENAEGSLKSIRGFLAILSDELHKKPWTNSVPVIN